jgi:hypothetical protein
MAPPRIELGHSRCKRDGLPLAYGAEAFSFSHIEFMGTFVTLAYGAERYIF